MENVGHILHHECYRFERSHISKVAQIEIPARINLERMGVFRHFAQLCSSDPGVSLARRTSNKNIHGLFNGTESEVLNQLLRVNLHEITRTSVMVNYLPVRPTEEVLGV